MTTGEGARTARLHRRRRRRRVLLALLAGVALLLAALALASRGGDGADGRGSEPAATPSPTPSGRTQTTLLLGLTVRGGATASGLLAADRASGQGSAVLVPSRLLAEVPGAGSMPFGRAYTLPGQTLAADALADLLGVTVDGTWRLDAAGLAGLVDALGGVPVEVDTDVLVRAPDGTATVAVPRGRAVLTGAQATRYAAYQGPDEQGLAVLPRVQAVLDGVLARLPSGDALTGLVAGLGTTSRSTVEPEDLADVLGVLARDPDGVAYETLPVLPLDAGGGAASYRLDEPRAQALVDRLLAGSVPPGGRGGGNRVLVLNGVGTPGLGERARALLVPAGFAYAGSSNVPGFGVEESEVLVREQTAQARALGARVAAALGLEEDAVRVSRREQTVADVVVVLGSDFAGTAASPTS